MARILGRKGEKVQYGGEEMTVRSALDLSTLILIDSNGDHHHASLSELEKEARGIPRDAINHDDIRASKVEPWVKACAHLLDDERHTKAEVALAAKELGVSVATVYRALERWRLSGETKDLPPPTRPGGRGKSRLLPAIEAIIQEQLERVLKKGGISKRKFLKDCRRAIDKAGFEVSPGTLRDRLASVPAYKFMKTRKGRDAVAREMDPIKGPYPNLSRPLQAVQIDHWKIDMEVVSDDRTRSVGRACSRCDGDVRVATEAVAHRTLVWQQKAEAAAKTGYIQLGGEFVPSATWFAIARQIAALMVNGPRSANFRSATAKLYGGDDSAYPKPTKRQPFEYLEVADRLRLFTQVAKLMEAWPHRFVQAAWDAGIRRSHAIKDMAFVPFIYESELRAYLDATPYYASDGEVAAAAAWLRRTKGAAYYRDLKELCGESRKAIYRHMDYQRKQSKPSIWLERSRD